MYLISNHHLLLLFVFLININKIAVPICSCDILPFFSYWNHSILIASFYLGLLVTLILGNSLLKNLRNKNEYTSFMIFFWSISNILITFFQNPNIIFLINFTMGLIQGLIVCSSLNSFYDQPTNKDKKLFFFIMVCAEMFGQCFSIFMHSWLFWKNIFISIGIFGFMLSLVNIKLKFSLLFIFPSFQNNTIEAEREIVNTKLVKEFFFYLPLWAIFIAQSSSNWTLMNAVYWTPLYLKNFYPSNSSAISQLFLGPLFYILVTAIRILSSIYLTQYINHHRIKQIMTMVGLIGSGIIMTILIFTTNISAICILTGFMIAISALNLNGAYIEHCESLPIGNSLITFLLSNSISSFIGIVNSFMNAFLITESHYRFFPVFFLGAFITFVGAIVYFVESSILDSENSRSQLKFSHQSISVESPLSKSSHIHHDKQILV